jgi:hypothetical protein
VRRRVREDFPKSVKRLQTSLFVENAQVFCSEEQGEINEMPFDPHKETSGPFFSVKMPKHKKSAEKIVRKGKDGDVYYVTP